MATDGHSFVINAGRTFPAVPDSVAEARRFLADQLDGRYPPDLVDVALLCLSEALTNSIRHSRSGLPRPVGSAPAAPGVVVLRVHSSRHRPHMHVDVQDEGPRQPGLLPRLLPESSNLLTEGGYGMRLIDRYTQQWTVRPSPAATCLSLTFDSTTLPHQRIR